MKIAIIGAGASGIVACIQAARTNPALCIDLFDSNNAVGKKILASGNGRCNISNTSLSSANYLGENPEFAQFALKEFDYNAFEKFCTSIGLLLDVKENNKVYPQSNEAKSVVNLLHSQLEHLGVNIIYETSIEKIVKINEKFTLQTQDKSFENYDKVLISTGLAAAPQLKSSEDGLTFAQSFGHTINPTYPSLVGLNVQESYCAKLQGVKKEVDVSLYINNQKEQEVFGDVLFTNYGVSGFAVLDISQSAAYSLSLYQEVHLTLNFFPNKNKNELIANIQTILKSNEEESAVILLSGLLPNKLCSVLLEICNMPKAIKAKEITPKQIRAIVNQLQNWKLKINDTQGFKHAEVSGGGVRVEEINNKTYESKLCKGLYFAGEVLDITGQRGGYNLHFAWASGYVVGKSLAR
ncbi:MAG: NAD(P)/FAD-dependent oxidoreductase [Arcobacteraceae bacterium]